MESGSAPPERPGGDQPGDPGSAPQPPESPSGSQAPGPQPPERQQPAPGPEQPAPGPQPPPGPAPPGPEAPPGQPGYGGPVPPGGWEQPVAAQPQWAGAELSGWWRRVGAYILDAIFTAIISWVGWILIAAGSTGIGITLLLVGIVVAFFYYPLTMMREGPNNGQSFGKQIAGNRVIRDDGQPVTFGFALLRQFVVIYLLFVVVGGVLFGIPWLIDVLWPLWDRENRALHDMIVKSHVVLA
jgi:uncharacterized RDD family membrane protein YckC